MSDSTTIISLPATGSSYPTFFEYKLTRATSGNSDVIMIPPGLRRGVSVILEVTSGSGKIQYTTTPRHLLHTAFSTAVWMDWSNGTVSSNAQNQFGPITGLRIVNSSGSQTAHVVGD